jgi:hypothetical protein
MIDDLQLPAYREAIRQICHEDLFFLAKEILGYQDMTENTHGNISRLLESKTYRRKLIITPRGSFKSSLGVVSFAIFRALQDPNIRILIDSEIYTNSSNFIREIRGHLESDLFGSLFGQFRTKNDWTEGSLTIATRTRSLKESTFTASGIGTEKTSQHYDLIIADDLNSPKNSQTDDGRQKVIDHYRYLNAILEPNGEFILIGTRYAANDVYGFVIENELDEEALLGLPESVRAKKMTHESLKGLL